MAVPLPITFLSDYGYRDDCVGVCHGVIRRIAPAALVIDIAHGLPRHEIRPAALMLRNSLPFMPEGVHLAVVDPGVGSERRAVALRCSDDRLLVGPDNGLLWLAAESFGGVQLAIDIGDSPHRLEPVSATFHGRDVFAPVAARLALGAPPEEAGARLAPDELVTLELPRPVVEPGAMTVHALYLDGFGNVRLNLDRDQTAAAGFEAGDTIEIDAHGSRCRAVYARTFTDVPAGDTLFHEDSYGMMAIAVSHGDAASKLKVEPDTPMHLVRCAP